MQRAGQARRNPLRGALAAVAMAGLLALGVRPAQAQLGVAPTSIVTDAETGAVLLADHPDRQRFPASLTKMMTLYMTFEALRDHRINLHQRVPVSARAASMEPTKLWLLPRTRITVEQCILGMITQSANDAAVAMGELLSGTEQRFARLMTMRAHALGMRRTVFRNASGLPDPAQVTTARDMATLARALIRQFPDEYHYFAVRTFVFQGRTIYGHDPMLDAYDGADGLKTGYTSAAGHNLATSAIRDGRRIIGIVLGAPSNARRDTEMVSLLDQGFALGDSTVLARSRPRPAMQMPTLIATADAAELPAGGHRRRSGDMLASKENGSARPLKPSGYAVQVGSFGTHEAALDAVRRAVATVGGVAHVHRFVVHGKPLWQGRVLRLAYADARRLCPQPLRDRGHCLILRSGQAD